MSPAAQVVLIVVGGFAVCFEAAMLVILHDRKDRLKRVPPMF